MKVVPSKPHRNPQNMSAYKNIVPLLRIIIKITNMKAMVVFFDLFIVRSHSDIWMYHSDDTDWSMTHWYYVHGWGVNLRYPFLDGTSSTLCFGNKVLASSGLTLGITIHSLPFCQNINKLNIFLFFLLCGIFLFSFNVFI